MKSHLLCRLLGVSTFLLCVSGLMSQTTRSISISSATTGAIFAQQQIRLWSTSSLIYQTYPSYDGRLYIDKNLQIPNLYLGSPPTAMTTRSLDQNLKPGSIGGSHSVDLGGAFNYDIPIKVPPGTSNMMPSVSLSYNSNSKDHQVGMGWSVSGISVIRRIPKDIMHDGVKSKIEFNATGPYMLDGNRLSYQGLNANGEQFFYTENETFSKITFKTGSGTYFEVKTKSGLTMIYGATGDSKESAPQNNYLGQSLPTITGYYLSKVIDNYGNYMEYSYYNLGTSILASEMAIKEIKYTGNTAAGISPYNSVKFYYDLRVDPQTRFFQGDECQETLLLREIDVFSEASQSIAAFNYKLLYSYGEFNQLNEVIFSGMNGERLNSTAFVYGDPPSSRFTISGILPQTLPTNADYAAADFNGDGLGDLIAYVYNAGATNPVNGIKFYNEWRLYLNNGTSGFTQVQSVTDNFAPFANFVNTYLGITPTKNGFLLADVKGSSTPELIYSKDNNTVTSDITFWEYDPTINSLVLNATNFNIRNKNSFNQAQSMSLGDFNGDGRTDLITFWKAPLQFQFKFMNFTNGTSITKTDSDPVILTVTDLSNNSVDLWSYESFSAQDVDGDGKSELIGYKQGNNVSVISVNISGTTIVLNEIWALPYNLNHSIYGDYNSDGYADFLSQPTSSTKKMYYGTGSGFIAGGNIPSTGFNPHMKNLALDINNDGKSDLLELYSDTITAQLSIRVSMADKLSNGYVSLGSVPNIFCPLNKNDEKENWQDRDYDGTPAEAGDDDYAQDANKIPVYEVGDFDGDGNQDLLLKVVSLVSTNPNVFSSQIQIIYFNQASDENYITSVYDGHDNNLEIFYFPLPYITGVGHFQSQPAPNYPLSNAILPINVVEFLTDNSNPLGTTEEYVYHNLMAHHQGRGVLGFDKIVKKVGFPLSTDYYQYTNESVVDPTYFVRKTTASKKEFISTTGNKIFNTTTYNSNIYGYNTGSSSRFFPEITSISTVDNYINSTTSVSYVNDYNTGNTLSIITNVGSGKEITQVTFSNFVNAGSWLNNVALNKTVTKTMQGESPYVRNTQYAYDLIKGSISSISEEPLSTKNILTSYTYDTNTGVIRQVTTSAPNDNTIPPPVATTVNYDYDSKFRFITKTTSPLNYISEAKYEPVFGNPIYSKDVDGLITKNNYNNFGELVETIYPDGTKTRFFLDWYNTNFSNPQDPKPVNLSDATYIRRIEYEDGKKENSILDRYGRLLKTETNTFNNGTISNLISYNDRGQVDKEYGPYLIPLPSGKAITEKTNTYSPDRADLLSQQVSDVTNNIVTSHQYNFNTTTKEISVMTTDPDGKIKTQTTDELGRLIKVLDNNGGLLEYEYHYDGTYFQNLTKLNGTTLLTVRTDNFNHLYDEVEPNNGTKQYTFNSFGHVKSMIDNKGTVYSYDYDILGRLTQKVIGPDYYNYIYNNSGMGIGQIAEINLNNGKAFKYSYDDLNRVKQLEEYLDGQSLMTQYEYNDFGQISMYRYPNKFFITNEYSNGNLVRIRNGKNNTMLWQLDELDNSGNIRKYTLGNNIQTIKTYDNFGFLNSTLSGVIQNLSYDFNKLNGNLKSITDNITGNFEQYGYDNLDRLNTINNGIYGGIANINYDGTGNITSKFDAGTYTYHGTKYNQVIQATNSNPVNSNFGQISFTQQDVNYTLFDKPTYISEGSNSANIYYGPDQGRYKTTFLTNNSLTNTRYYFSGMDRNIDAANVVTDVNYIEAPTGLCAMYVSKSSAAPSMFYIYNDHLGSLVAASDAGGNVVAEQNFDAWGRRRDATTQSYLSVNNVPDWLYRGYTGHEYLPQFDLINMNARLYDPQVARMLSVDAVLPDPTNSQAYNKYTYAYNNPLKYTDPSGNAPKGLLDWFWTSPSQGNISVFNLTSPGGMHRFVNDNTLPGQVGNSGSQTTAEMDAYSMNATGDKDWINSSPYTPGMRGPSGHLDANHESAESRDKDASMLLGGQNLYHIRTIDNRGFIESWYTTSGKVARKYSGPNNYGDLMKGGGAWLAGDVNQITGNDENSLDDAIGAAIFGSKGNYNAIKANSGNSNPYMYTYQEMQDQADLVTEGTLMFVPIGEMFELGRLSYRAAKAANFFKKANFSSKVLKQMGKADDLYHGFPEYIDAWATKYGQWSKKVGGDGETYQWLEMKGTSLDGKSGTYEYIKNSEGLIDHRFFNAYSH